MKLNMRELWFCTLSKFQLCSVWKTKGFDLLTIEADSKEADKLKLARPVLQGAAGGKRRDLHLRRGRIGEGDAI